MYPFEPHPKCFLNAKILRAHTHEQSLHVMYMFYCGAPSLARLISKNSRVCHVILAGASPSEHVAMLAHWNVCEACDYVCLCGHTCTAQLGDYSVQVQPTPRNYNT